MIDAMMPSITAFPFATLARWILCALLVFAPLARGAFQPWAVTAIHLGVLAALCALALDRILSTRRGWIATVLDRPLACLWGLCLMATVFSRHRPASLQALALMASWTAIFYLTIHLFDTRDRMRRLVRLLAGVAVFLTVFGLFKRFGLNPFAWWTYPDLHYPVAFMAATYGNHNHLAGYLEMVLPLTIGAILFARSAGGRALWAYLALLLIAGLILSLSRGGWVATMASLGFLLATLAGSRYFFHRKALLGTVAGVIVVAVLVLASTPVVERIRTVAEGDEAASMESRIQAWYGVLAMIADHPWLGAGPGTFGILGVYYQPPGLAAHFSHAHNDYLEFIAELGPGLVPLIGWLAAAFFRHGFRRQRHPSRLVRGITLGAMTGVVAILVHSIVDFNLHVPANAMLFSVLAALVVAPVPKASPVRSREPAADASASGGSFGVPRPHGGPSEAV